jgi:HAD superfamily hydrolase (TIGR01509 family)
MTHAAWPCDLVVFDLDGTLVNTAGLHVAATQAAVRAVFGQEAPPTLVARSLGCPLPESMAIVSDGRGQIPALMAAFLAHYADHEAAGAQPFADAIPTLMALHTAGMPVALLSNKLRAWGQAEIARLGLAPWLARAVFAEDMPLPKPDPQALAPLLHTFHVTPARVLVIGDGLADLHCAQAAGALAGAALWGPHDPAPLLAANPDYTFHQMREILALFGV